MPAALSMSSSPLKHHQNPFQQQDEHAATSSLTYTVQLACFLTTTVIVFTAPQASIYNRRHSIFGQTIVVDAAIQSSGSRLGSNVGSQSRSRSCRALRVPP